MVDIKNFEENINWKDLIYKAGKYKYDFQQYETRRSFSESIYIGETNTEEDKTDQTNLLENMVNFNDKSRPKNKESKYKKYFG